MEQAKIVRAAEMQHDTFPRLLSALGLEIKEGMVIALKVNFLEPMPAVTQALFMALASQGANPFLADCAIPYGDALQTLNAAAMNGYVGGAPVVLADGVKGTDYDHIPVRGGKLLRSAKFGRAITDADLVLTVTRPAFDDRGFRGVLHDLGFGCASRAGKTEVQTSGKPIVDEALCIGCGKCSACCEHGGARLDPETKKASIFPPKCSGCYKCMRACPVEAIRPNFDVSDTAVMQKVAEYAKALCDARAHAHLLLLDDAYVSLDPVALDALCAQKLALPEESRAGIDHAAALGLGSGEFSLEEI